jgi:hypothetical protein
LNDHFRQDSARVGIPALIGLLQPGRRMEPDHHGADAFLVDSSGLHIYGFITRK